MIRMTDEAIIAKYQEINQAIDKLGKRLITKLSKYGVEKDHESFTDLIHAISEIRSIERYYTNNSLPTETDLVSVTYNGIKYNSNGSLIEFNDSLIQKLVFYIKLLKYYLALKGVDLNYINNANTVVELIELIDFIDAILSTSLTITNVKTEYYAGEDIMIFYSLIDSEGNEVIDGNIEVYDNDMLITTTSAGSSIMVTPATGSHVIKLIYKGTEKYEESQDSFSFTMKPGRIILDTIVANQTESSLYYRSADTGLSEDKWYIKVVTKDSKGNILPNVPLTIKDVMLDDEGEIESSILLTNNAISDSNGIYIIQNISLSDYREHIIDIETQYLSESISDREERYFINTVHSVYYNQYPFMLYYEGQTQDPIVIELHNEDGEKPYDEDTNTYLYDGATASVKIINILNEETILNTTKTVTNGNITIDIDLPVGYYHIILDTILDLSINYADIHFNMEEYSITLPNLTFGINNDVISETNIQSLAPEENETGHGYIEATDDDINSDDYNETHKYHVYGLFIVDVRENLDLIKNATDSNGNIQISTTKILSAINDEDTNFIKSLTLSNDIISSESITRDNNKTIALNLEEAIGKIYLNDDKNIEYETVGDIYSLDNRKLQYNKQQG